MSSAHRDLVEWMPLEFNSSADYLCNWAMYRQSSVEHVLPHALRSSTSAGCDLRVNSDGGQRGTSCAATGWMTRGCICDETGTFHESVVATAATYITAGLTPFGAEVIALDMAFQIVDLYML